MMPLSRCRADKRLDKDYVVGQVQVSHGSRHLHGGRKEEGNICTRKGESYECLSAQLFETEEEEDVADDGDVVWYSSDCSSARSKHRQKKLSRGTAVMAGAAAWLAVIVEPDWRELMLRS